MNASSRKAFPGVGGLDELGRDRRRELNKIHEWPRRLGTGEAVRFIFGELLIVEWSR